MMREIHDNGGASASGAMEENEGGGSGGAEVDMDDCGSLALPPDLPPYSGDYIISDYMERLGTRLNILETELKYAWRALDLLSQEYVRMWERLERLEALLADQQGVISTLLDFYTCRTVTGRDPMTRLEVIREILGNGTIEDGIEEGLDIGRSSNLLVPQDDEMESNEAFYKSLNQAYRDDLVCEETSRPPSQLDMIWEAPEEHDLELVSASGRQVYSSTDYKDYCGLQGGPEISERDLVHLSTLSTIDQITVDKLHELDRLTNQLHKDSRELKDLKTRLLSPETKHSSKHERDIEAKALVEDGNIINEQLKSVYPGGENWGGINDMMKTFDDFMLTTPKESISREKSPSRLSLADSTLSDRKNEYLQPTLSPRRKYVPERTSTEPYTTVTGRLAYSSAVANAEINAAKLNKSPSALSRDRFEYSSSYQIAESSRHGHYSSKGMSQPFSEIYKSSTEQNSPLSIHEIYNGPTERLELSYEEGRIRKSPSPPPPAPPNGGDLFPSIENNNELTAHQSMLSTGGTVAPDGLRLSPRSPKSPKTSPKHLKRDNTNIVAAKSDSGLSSMSGWSSLEKSPGSPKTGRIAHGHDSHKMRIPSPQSVQRVSYEVDPKPYLETLVDSYMYDGKKGKCDYNLRKDELIAQELRGSRDLSKLQAKVENDYLKSEFDVQETAEISSISEYYYNNEAPSIYSVAGNRQPIFTTVYSTPRGMLSEDRNFSELLDRNEIVESTVRSAVDSYPPEPSYHAQTVVMPAANSNKRTLTRANTAGPGDPHFYQNGYKGAGRGGYPPGNLTDALSYYPTSSRYDSPKRTSLEDQLSWQGRSSPSSSMETSSLKSHSLSITERKQFQNQLQQEYFKQQQYDQRNGNVMYENQGYENPDVSKMRKEQYVDSSGVLVTESGYVSISSNFKSKPQDRSQKKPKRTSSLKSAMSSMSHWLPDLHLPKKHRSHSLPSGVDTAEPSQQEKSLKERILNAQRRKKKYHLVASMSGLLQKARRKNQASHQSLSDPETSETEWSGGRSSAQSEDSDSVFSDSAHEGNMFVKVAPKPKQRKMNNQEIIEQQQLIQELQEQGFRDDDVSGCIIEEAEYPANTNLPRDKSDDIDFHFARVNQMKQKDNIQELEKLDIDTDISNVDLFEEEEKEDNQSPASLFATIGDVKKASVGSSDENGQSENNKPYLHSSGGSQEFAVSRALGKYRLRKSTSISDEHVADNTAVKSETEIQEDVIEEKPPVKERRPHKTTSSTPEIISSEISHEGSTLPERSPSIQSTRGLPNKFQPRHQQSLEIPNKHDDDDSRSTHSWRSGSRVSSRRQSTEDSIDSEDEWYCYELRKLEEMEHQSQLEIERQQTLTEEPEFEEISEEPEEDLKEKMSFVLRELKLKTANAKTKYDESPVKDSWKDITTFPAIEESADDMDDKDYDDDKSYADSGSGETSGPDSPVMSGDELDDDYDMPQIHEDSPPAQAPQPSQDAPVGSKWKLLKALKDRKAEEKTTEPPSETTTSTEKDKVTASNGSGGFNEQGGRGNGYVETANAP